MKLNYDLHIHTEYCGHAPGMTVEKICRRADDLGLQLIAITDHSYSPRESAPADLIREQVEACRPRCRVVVGAEVDVDAAFADGRLAVENLDDYDYIVAGFHYVPLLGHYPRGPEDRRMEGEEFMRVWESTLMGVVSNPRVHTLAHPARLFASCVDLDAFLDHGLAVLERAAQRSAENNIAWELNELDGFRIPAAHHERFCKMYENALEAGVRLVYGSDAHMPESIGRCDYVQCCLDRLPAGSLSEPQAVLNKPR